VSGAPPDVSGQPTSEAAVDWQLMGAEEGTRDMTWEQIEEGADKLRVEGGDICKTAASRKRKRWKIFWLLHSRIHSLLVNGFASSHTL